MKSSAKKRLHLAVAVAITLLILALPTLFGGEFNRFPQYGAIWLGSAIWAALEVRRLRFYRFRVAYPYRATGTFFFVIVLWFFAFPWFLVTWLNITSGLAKSRDEAPGELSPLAKSLLRKHDRRSGIDKGRSDLESEDKPPH